MPYISELIGKTVTDIDGETVGTLKDLIAAQGLLPVPRIVAIEVKQKDHTILISMADVAVLIAPGIPLNRKVEDIKPYQPTASDLFLAEAVLDKQIIDTDGVRVVRVNDLELTRVNDEIYVSNVDVGGSGLMRRLGLPGFAKTFTSRTKSQKLTGVISWEDVELLSNDQPMRLKVPGDKLAELHPADLAQILSDLTRTEGHKLLESLDDETLADALEEVEPEFQASLVEQMPNERVADVLEEMSPDEAADLLAELPEDRSQELLNLMEKDEAEDVRRLLAFPENSAGGIMNTEFVTVPPDMTVDQVLKKLRDTANEESEAETIYYIYVTDTEGRLEGVFSLRQLVMAQPRTPVKNFMEDRVVSVDLLDGQDHLAQIISKYNLLAVPVVDNDNRIQGIVTADDALDKIIPTAWKKRLPRLYH